MKSKVESVKKSNVLLTFSFGVLLLLAGCGKCQECSFDSGGSETICETEFDTPSEYELALDQAEANGATCTSSGGI